MRNHPSVLDINVLYQLGHPEWTVHPTKEWSIQPEENMKVGPMVQELKLDLWTYDSKPLLRVSFETNAQKVADLSIPQSFTTC